MSKYNIVNIRKNSIDEKNSIKKLCRIQKIGSLSDIESRSTY